MTKFSIPIKPLSVNEAWKGQRYKTDAYKKYEKAMFLLLPKIKVGEGKLGIDIEYGFSNSASDVDNPTKLFLDILSKKYGFNDSRIYELTLRKTIVKKGKEFISVYIEILENSNLKSIKK